jgi:hypothetical protein
MTPYGVEEKYYPFFSLLTKEKKQKKVSRLPSFG